VRLAFAFLSLLAAVHADALDRVKFNHPGLVVDLAVGLWAFPIPCDADGNGDHDLVVICPDKPYNGTWLFENPAGKGERFPVFKPARRLGVGRQDAMPSYIGGQLRVLTPAQEYPDFLRTGLDAPRPLAPAVPANPHQRMFGKAGGIFKIRENQWRIADFDGDGAEDLVVGIADWSEYGWDDAWDASGHWKNGPLHGVIYLLRNRGAAYEPPQLIEAGGKPLDVYGRVSPNFADFDGDGDLDLLCGEFLDGFTYFENAGTRTKPRYTAGKRLAHEGRPLAMDLEMIVPIAFDWDSDGDLDLIVGDEDGRVAFVENTGRIVDHVPDFLPPRYFQQEADELKSGALATPVGVDWDGDADIDIVSGNSAGYFELFENLSGPRVAQPRWAAPHRLEADGNAFRITAGPNGSIQGPAEAKWGYTSASIADWDGDGRPDIVFNSIWGRVQWLRRTDAGLAAPVPIEVEWPGAPPRPAWTWWTPHERELVTQWRTTPVIVDWNRDGLPDLVMLDSEGYLAFFERAKRDSGLVLLPPRRAFIDEHGRPLQLATKRAGGSGRRKLCSVDWDGDGLLDLLVNSENANFFRQLEQRGDAWVLKDCGKLAEKNIASHDVSPTTVDWDGDGVPDYVGGAEDGHFYFLKNGRGP
jgi:hypothetical protein